MSRLVAWSAMETEEIHVHVVMAEISEKLHIKTYMQGQNSSNQDQYPMHLKDRFVQDLKWLIVLW